MKKTKQNKKHHQPHLAPAHQILPTDLALSFAQETEGGQEGEDEGKEPAGQQELCSGCQGRAGRAAAAFTSLAESRSSRAGRAAGASCRGPGPGSGESAFRNSAAAVLSLRSQVVEGKKKKGGGRIKTPIRPRPIWPLISFVKSCIR